MINRDTFFPHIRSTIFGNTMTQRQVDGVTFLLDVYEKDKPFDDLRHLAECLGTTAWETGMRMQPVEEIGHGKGRTYGVPAGPWHKVYDGRGDVQLTWQTNYQKATNKLRAAGVLLDIPADDLVRNPERALDPTIAAAILFFGMRDGWFTGRKLADFDVGHDKYDWTNARRIINGVDHAADVGKLALSFYTALGLSQATGLSGSSHPIAPAGGSSPAAKSAFVATEKASTPMLFNLSSLTAIASLVQAGMGVYHDYSAAAPALAKDAGALKDSGKAILGDVSSVVSKIKAGHYADTVVDVQKGFADLSAALGVITKDVQPVANLISATAKGLPSPAGAAAVLKQLGHA